MDKRVVALQIPEENESSKLLCGYESLLSYFHDDLQKIHKDETVLIKPNLVAPFEKATTDITLLECVVDTLLDIGAIPIIAESSGFEFSTEETFKYLGVNRLAEKDKVRVINLDNEEFIPVQSDNSLVPEYLLPKLVFEVNHVINMPCLKGHSLTKVTFSIKNLFGLLHRDTRRKIHATDLNLGISCLKKLIPVDLIIVDGLWNLTNAVYSETSYQGICLIGNDMDAVDQICCQLFGIDYSEIPHIKLGFTFPQYEYIELSNIDKLDNKVQEREMHFIKQNKRYKLLYCVDLFFSKFVKKSIIPYAHYYLGLRPFIQKKKCTNCKRCEKVCPIGAIKNSKINVKKCMKLRCMKCFNECPQGAVIQKGIHK